MPISSLRNFLNTEKVDGIYFIRTNQHFTENLPEHEEFIRYITGFTGSAGAILVTHEHAVLFVDSRYTLQAAQEVNTQLWDIQNLEDKNEWIKSNITQKCIGYDPSYISLDSVENLNTLTKTKAIRNSPFIIWNDRPEPVFSEIYEHKIEYSGEDSSQKLKRIGQKILACGADVTLITALDSVAWALNLRGNDIPFCPLFYGALIIDAYGNSTVFVHSDEAPVPEGTIIKPYASLALELTKIRAHYSTFLIDKSKTNVQLISAIQQSKIEIIWGRDPISELKAIKNSTEIANLRVAHQKDALAFKSFHQWFSRQAPKASLSELDIIDAIYNFRIEAGAIGLSFPTIAGVGANGAIVHYHADAKTNKQLEHGTLILIDSGAQYLEGTTDITRTYAIGRPSQQMIRHTTLVLKAHIQLTLAKFPAGTTGSQLDAIARAPLWSAGMDYGHGTGHGVGSYLCVHEGPCSISKKSHYPLDQGMVLTIEPGYYLPDRYGIRIENMVVIHNEPLASSGDFPMLGFETLTKVPYDTSLIDFTLLTSEERLWLIEYLDVKM